MNTITDINRGCDWHVHSMFHPCPNGLYRRDYLFGNLPRTVQGVLNDTRGLR